MRLFSTLLFVLITLCSFGQFTNISSSFDIVLTGSTAQSGCGASFYDIDHDGWDDLTVGEPFNPILVYHNNNGAYVLIATFDNTGDPKSVMWVDYDNDGDSDFFFSIMNQSCKLFRNEGNMIFTDVTSNLGLPSATAKSFGCAWGDYDDDGFLDVYICNYSNGPGNPTNWLLHNNADGTFSDVTNAMGVGNGIKPSYQCSWIDVNQDGLLDIYVANDYDNLNELYLNNGVTFDAAGAAWGLNVAMEGMSNAWNDFDSDGDFDIFISNNLDGNVLLRNDNNFMTDIAATAGVQVHSTCWGSLWMDYDHDGLDDLHISTSAINVNSNQNYLYHNNGDYTFSDSSMTTDKQIVFSSIKGDQNNDGWWDFLEMKQYPAAIALWQNNGGSNHWVKMGLTGTVSNRDAVGSIIKYYYPGKSGMQHTFCGEGFLAQNSSYHIISLAENTVLDSVLVEWPSGWVDHYYNLQADQVYNFIEGETYQVNITNPNDALLCASGNSVTLIATEGSAYVWSNDSTTSQIEVTAAGMYSVVVTNAFGLQAQAEYEVLMYDEPTINESVVMPSCNNFSDGCIQLSAVNGDITNVIWNDVTGSENQCELSAGNYHAVVTDSNGCEQSFDYVLEQPDAISITANADTACFQSTVIADVNASGGTGTLMVQFSENANPDALYAGEYTITVLDENNCMAQAVLIVEEFPQLNFVITPDTVCANQTVSLQYDVNGGVAAYTIDWQGENPDELPAGEYVFSVVDQSNCEVSASVTISESSAMEITSTIQNAAGGNNGSITVSVSGGMEPFTFMWNDEIGGSSLTNIGQGTYHVQITDAAGCSAEADIPIVDTHISEMENSIFISPNPCRDILRIQLHHNDAISIYDTYGKVIFTSNLQQKNFTLDTSSWSSGVYILSCGKMKMRIVVE